MSPHADAGRLACRPAVVESVTLHSGERIEGWIQGDEGVDLLLPFEAEGYLALSWDDLAELILALTRLLERRS